jgi:rfaE bifunctional protein nucleotidyltransferase chain/domain
MSNRMGVLVAEQAIELVRRSQADGLIVGMCHGCFDILHFGHLRHLASAASLCDLLVVSVTADAFVNKGPNRPIFKDSYRAELLAGLACVHTVVVSHHPTAIEMLDRLRPNRYFKGQDYHISAPIRNPGFEREREFAQSLGIEVMHTFEETFSSTETLSRLYEALRD